MSLLFFIGGYILKGKLFNLLVLLGLAAASWFLNAEYVNPYLEKLFLTFVSLSVIYFVFSVVFSELIGARIRGSRSRYNFRKAMSVLQLVFIAIAAVTVWVENPQALLVAYGIIGAGVAVSLQDVFKNLAGGVTIFLTGTYAVGDRIEINNKRGDVIDIGIMYTTIQEIGEWVAGDQPTGRITVLPNSLVISQPVNNYTRDNRFMWDELMLPLTYDSDWLSAVEKTNSILINETADTTSEVEKELSSFQSKYYVPEGDVKPAVIVSYNDNWVELRLRYVTEVRKRRNTRNKISRAILEELGKMPKVKIASSTLTVSLEKK